MCNAELGFTDGVLHMSSAKAEPGPVAKRIRYFRERKEMRQQDLAEKAGMSRSYIARIERGPDPPPHDKMVNIAHALGVTPGELLEQFSDEHARVEATRNAPARP